MKILHTADWHLGDRLGRIDRTADLRRAVERVAGYCERERVEVLLMAGDLFSELSRPDGLRDSIAHLQEVFTPFLVGGGTIVALTGNHDNEVFCQTLRHAMTLAAPGVAGGRGSVPAGRFYLAADPTLLRLAGRGGEQVQFLLMPYPTPPRYLEGAAQQYGSLEEKNRALQGAYTLKLQQLLDDRAAYDPALPTVLSAHIHLQGGKLPSLFRMSERESIVFSSADVPAGLAYVALGHIHRAQCPLGDDARHVRYSGSVERLDLGERLDEKGVVLLEVGAEGLRGEPAGLPLVATPMYDLDIVNPADELPRLRERYPDADRALVRYRLVWTAGVDNREAVLRELDAIFPRWYEREVREANALGLTLTDQSQPAAHPNFGETVRGYLQTELMNHPDPERDALLQLAEALLQEEEHT
jgi:exonuclease SbcD